MNTRAMLIVAILCLGMGNGAVLAQADQAEKTLLRPSKDSTNTIGFFIAPQYGIGSLRSVTTHSVHLRVGLLRNTKVALGAYYSQWLNDVRPEGGSTTANYLDFWSVGGFVEYTLFTNKVVHATLPLNVGFGEIEMDNEAGNANLGEANFFLVEPMALVEINLHHHVRFTLGAGYRIAGAFTYANVTQNHFNGFTAYMGLKVGVFH